MRIDSQPQNRVALIEFRNEAFDYSAAVRRSRGKCAFTELLLFTLLLRFYKVNTRNARGERTLTKCLLLTNVVDYTETMIIYILNKRFVWWISFY